MADPELTRFAELLMQFVRDRAIHESDRRFSGHLKGRQQRDWASLGVEARAAVEDCVPEVVDQTLFELLDAIDNRLLPLAWERPDGTFVRLSELGLEEMAGWLAGSPGWRHEFSAERFFDPLGDLRLNAEGDGEQREP